MKKIICVLLAIIISSSFSIVSYAEPESSITDEEANDLILDAFYLDKFINKLTTLTPPGNFDLRKISESLMRIEKKESEIIEIAKSVYSDEIASHIVDGWEKDNSKKAPIFCQDLNEYMSSYGFEAFLYPLILFDGYSGDAYTNALGNFPNNEYIIWEYNANGKAYGKVKMCVKEAIPDRSTDYFSRPVYVSVSFSKQKDGWRIDGGEFVNAMTNVYATKFEDACDLKHAVPLLICWIDKELSEHGFEHWWREDEFVDMGAVEPNPMPALKEIKAVSIEKDSVELICRVRITNSKFQVLCAGEFSAVFKIVHAAKDDPEYINLPGASYDEFSEVWFVLSDGGMYELLVKNNMRPLQYNGEPSPYTGDESVKEMIIFTSVAITAACACLCLIRKRKKIEE